MPIEPGDTFWVVWRSNPREYYVEEGQPLSEIAADACRFKDEAEASRIAAEHGLSVARCWSANLGYRRDATQHAA